MGGDARGDATSETAVDMMGVMFGIKGRFIGIGGSGAIAPVF